jgi:maltoporin
MRRLVVLLAACALAGCGGPSTEPTEALPPPTEQSGVVLRESEFGDAWLFAEPSVQVDCRGKDQVVVIVAGKTYGVNIPAKSKKGGNYPEFESIIKDIPDQKNAIYKLIDGGLALCPK